MRNIRDLNSHFVHDFEKIKTDNIDSVIIDFLKQSFELAIVQTYLNENNLSYESFITSPNSKEEIVNFLFEKFYNTKDIEDTSKEIFKNKSQQDAINTILFINTENDYEWKLFEEHHIFNITKGEYLSFEACLFLLSTFLYKGEANQLISKIREFKRNDDSKLRSKRNIFSFYSKRFSSQDINSEEKHLIKFRDIIQYLNHYPTIWNKDLELESNNPTMTDKLKEKIIELEIKRSYPEYNSNERFLMYAKYQIFGRKHLGKSFEKEYLKISYTDKEIDDFNYEINTCPEVKDAYVKLYNLEQKDAHHKGKDYKIRILESTIKEKENNLNPITEKLKTRISKSLLYVSYGRNQDHFMDFATRFLAETNYFGADAEFKMYQFYSSEEQNEELENLKKNLSKKEYDKLKYHKGKLIHFSKYNNHLQNYEYWDTPFVIENNAVHIKLGLSSGVKIVCIQRSLMIYFLEDALFNANKNDIEKAGQHLLQKYYAHHSKEFSESKTILEQNNYIRPEEKSLFKKIFPKRLLRHYSLAQQNNLHGFTSLGLLLENAKKAEQRYRKLVEKVEKEERVYKQSNPEDKYVSLVEDFLKRNKGKQFKLRFIRKAWHLMYFKDTYLNQVKEHGHHKRFHITKDEFNNFSKWMFAFDETPEYKKYLTRLFTNKDFFANDEFKDLFEKCSSLNEMYDKTKTKYQNWLINYKLIKTDANKYKLYNYEKFFSNDLFYINVFHFTNYLEKKQKIARDTKGRLIYKSLENVNYLISEFYYKAKLEKTEYKTCGKLYNKLKSVKLEDTLLYEIAMHYLKIDKSVVESTKTNITKILKQDIILNIQNTNEESTFKLKIPFNKINAYKELILAKTVHEAEHKGTSVLGNVIPYIRNVKNNKDIKQVYKSFEKNSYLTYDDLYKINNHIITHSVKFTKIALALEKYFVYKDNIHIETNNNRINLYEIESLKQYFEYEIRKRAFHFNIPKEDYKKIINDIETKFIKDEVIPAEVHNYRELSKQLKSVCDIFLNTMHNDFFDFKEKDKKRKRINAENKFFNELINKRAN